MFEFVVMFFKLFPKSQNVTGWQNNNFTKRKIREFPQIHADYWSEAIILYI